MKFKHLSYAAVVKPWAIDPKGCGCTECIIGEYVPMDEASALEWLRVLTGDIDNHTGLTDDELHARAMAEFGY